jgi:hypothetical protein
MSVRTPPHARWRGELACAGPPRHVTSCCHGIQVPTGTGWYTAPHGVYCQVGAQPVWYQVGVVYTGPYGVYTPW